MLTRTTATQTIVERLSIEVQLKLVEDIRRLVGARGLMRAYTIGQRPMSVRVVSAGALAWVGGRSGYVTPRAPYAIPASWRALADRVAGRQPWDCALVMLYAPDSRLGLHQDVDEHDKSYPIVSISLGDSCSWAIAPPSPRRPRRRELSRAVLESGCVTMLANETRRYWHSVERIIAAPLLSPLGHPGRYSITFRVAGDPEAM